MKWTVVIFSVLVISGCEIDKRECLSYEEKTIVTHPNMGLMAIKGMAAIALMPVYKKVKVCTEYAETKGT